MRQFILIILIWALTFIVVGCEPQPLYVDGICTGQTVFDKDARSTSDGLNVTLHYFVNGEEVPYTLYAALNYGDCFN